MLQRCKLGLQQWNYLHWILFFFYMQKFLQNDFFNMIEWAALVNKSLWLSGVSMKNHFKMGNVFLLAANLITDWDLRLAWVRKSITVNTMSAFIVVKVTVLFAVISAGWFEKSALYYHKGNSWHKLNQTCCSLWWITGKFQVSASRFSYCGGKKNGN